MLLLTPRRLGSWEASFPMDHVIARGIKNVGPHPEPGEELLEAA